MKRSNRGSPRCGPITRCARNRVTLRDWGWLALLGLLASMPLRADLLAVQLDETNLQLRPGGLDALAGRGDWLLSNGHLCAAVSDIGHETGLSAKGGWLIDLGHCGRADDQFSYTHLVPMMRNDLIMPGQRIETETAVGRAAIVVHHQGRALAGTVRYQLDAAEPATLKMVSEVWRTAPGDKMPLIGQMWLHPHRSMTPFVVATDTPALSPGFRHASYQDAFGAMAPADLNVLIGDPNSGPPISYGIKTQRAVLIDADGEERELNQFAVSGQWFSFQGWMTRPLWLGRDLQPGWARKLQMAFMDIGPGEKLRFEQVIIVGDRADAAAVTDRVYQGEWVHGKVDSTRARLLVSDEQGHPITDSVPAADGSFRFRVPAGLRRIVLELNTPWAASRTIDVELDGDYAELAALTTAPPGSLRLPLGAPMRLVFKGLGATPDPRFNDDLSGFTIGGERFAAASESNAVYLTGTAHDPARVELPPGRYRVYATRGIDYQVETEEIAVRAGKETRLAITPPAPAFDLTGWVSGDLHVHSGYSWDSSISAEQRLHSFIAQGADFLVAAEHDVLTDLAAVARAMGIDDRVTVVAGVEMTGTAATGETPKTIGHVNAYPLARQDGEFAGGAPAHEGQRLRKTMAEIKAQHPDALIQLNHPRDPSDNSYNDGSFFDHLSIGRKFDSKQPLTAADNHPLVERDPASGLRDLDFDVLELLNGDNLKQYQLVRADWIALILQGEYRAAVANSDSHSLSGNVAMPRTYLAYPGLRRHPLDIDSVLAAVRGGRAFGSSGPIPLVELVGGGQRAAIGDTIEGREFNLVVTAQAAPWVNVDQVLVYVDGVSVHQGAIKAGQTIEVPLTVARDSFVFVELYGQATEIYRVIAPGFIPMAFTNPIWIDADGDGHWQAPGLVPLPPTISDPGACPLADGCDIGSNLSFD
jgi:hypothetical protein